MKKNYLHLLVLALLLFAGPSLLRAGDKKAVAACNGHALVLKQDGSLWAFGANDFGQQGDGTTARLCLAPKLIMDGVAEASAGDSYSFVRRNDGSLWGWGANSGGQLGIGNHNRQLPPVRIAAQVGDFAAGVGVSLWITPAGELKITGDIDFFKNLKN